MWFQHCEQFMLLIGWSVQLEYGHFLILAWCITWVLNLCHFVTVLRWRLSQCSELMYIQMLDMAVPCFINALLGLISLFPIFVSYYAWIVLLELVLKISEHALHLHLPLFILQRRITHDVFPSGILSADQHEGLRQWSKAELPPEAPECRAPGGVGSKIVKLLEEELGCTKSCVDFRLKCGD